MRVRVGLRDLIKDLRFSASIEDVSGNVDAINNILDLIKRMLYTIFRSDAHRASTFLDKLKNEIKRLGYIGQSS
jgi:hypothetical protein